MLGNPILQFGTSRFLQAHVDLFVSEALDSGEALGGITVVQTTGNPASAARVSAMARDEGYDVLIRGLVDGKAVEIRKRCRSVRAALNASDQWQTVRAEARGPVQIILSNTGDSGWQLSADDHAGMLAGDAPVPQSYPAKLLVLLHDRWQARPRADLTVLPCELVSSNGERLLETVVGLAQAWRCASIFRDWLVEHVVWANSLVDRIVSEALEPVGAVAEPYALWAIERQPRLLLPCRHKNIVVTDCLAPYERLKLFFLNLGHTLLADLWLKGTYPKDMTVLEAMGQEDLRTALEGVWQEEVLPVLEQLGQGDEARAYMAEVRDRFLNPFLVHRLADIAQNHEQKKLRRLEPVVNLAMQHLPELPQWRLRAALKSDT